MKRFMYTSHLLLLSQRSVTLHARECLLNLPALQPPILLTEVPSLRMFGLGATEAVIPYLHLQQVTFIHPWALSLLPSSSMIFTVAQMHRNNLRFMSCQLRLLLST